MVFITQICVHVKLKKIFYEDRTFPSNKYKEYVGLTDNFFEKSIYDGNSRNVFILWPQAKTFESGSGQHAEKCHFSKPMQYQIDFQ